MRVLYLSLFIFLSIVTLLFAQKDRMVAETFTGLSLREIGPGLASGRIGDFAVHPGNRSHYFVAVSSGGVWRTRNSGTTWTPVFDDQGSYSIGCVAIDPSNPFIIWVGTGENNSQRSVSYGDGIYKSIDDGGSWKNMGLKNSEHIGMITVDPRNSNIVYVAAQGPLWNSGGDRGLYKTTNGGETWKRILHISENTGVNEVHMDPRDPDVLYASSYQRRRHVWALINGGPESAIYKSTDAGANWKKLEKGLPNEDMGKIGLAISPANPDIVYAIIEAANDESGFFRSTDRGESWAKMSSYVSQSSQYYNEIFADPVDVDRVYSMDTWMHITEDGGKTFKKIGEKYKHVDNHALWIDPDDYNYLLAGCDGGVYESFDRGTTWHFKANLPVTQFYRVTADNDFPFYNVYGGTQDNATLGGPSRTTTEHGITNRDWFVTIFGDGFKTRIDPEDPNIIYSQYQYGGLARFDKRSGEQLYIQPQPEAGEKPLRWNWDSPLIISPHSHTRLYYAANRIFRSDDRGNTWTAVSPDLTRQLNRNKLSVMGKVWSIDAVSKNASTSYYGNIVSLSESPLKEGLLYAGTDDGLIQVSEDSGKGWRKIEEFPGVPELSYVSKIEASQHDMHTVYAAFDNHKMGDFHPYILKSTNLGKSWKSIAGDLPEKGTVYAFAEDHEKPDLLFAGTEYGVFFTIDGGKQWVQLKGGIPVIAVRDIDIQKRENDLVVGTFGRGIYILDNYTPLRLISPSVLQKEAVLFPVKKTLMYIQNAPLGLRGKSMQGDSYYSAPNPPFGAVITYYLRDELKTLKKQRQEKEKEIEKSGGTIDYPNWESLRKELREEKPAIVINVMDGEGNLIRRLTGPISAGIHRVAWDLRFPASTPTDLKPPSTDNPFSSQPVGPMVVPGSYQVSIAKKIDGDIIPLSETQKFATVALGTVSLPAEDKEMLLAFQRKTARLQRAVLGANKLTAEIQSRINHIRQAIMDTPEANPALLAGVESLENKLKDIKLELTGDPLRKKYHEPDSPSITSRVSRIIWSHWGATAETPATLKVNYRIAGEKFMKVLGNLKALVSDLENVELEIENAGAPWTPGRVPTWKPE